jgi:hypothetical protein
LLATVIGELSRRINGGDMEPNLFKEDRSDLRWNAQPNQRFTGTFDQGYAPLSRPQKRADPAAAFSACQPPPPMKFLAADQRSAE